jgi:hypothetical protein
MDAKRSYPGEAAASVREGKQQPGPGRPLIRLSGTKPTARSSLRMVMNDSAQYRKFAEQCRKQAGQCKMPGERNSWLHMADEWEALAKEAVNIPGHISQKSKAEGD